MSNKNGIKTTLTSLPAQAVRKIQGLLQAGRKIEAIKELREMCSIGLKEAMEAIQAEDWFMRTGLARYPKDLPRRIAEDTKGAGAIFIGCHLLVKLFDGNPDRWLSFLRKKGSDDQIVNDYPLALWFKSELKQDPQMLGRIRAMVAAHPLPSGQKPRAMPT